LPLEQLTDEELRKSIEEKLMSDWILIRGDPNVVGVLERAVYPPGTAMNEDFVAYWLPRVSDNFFLGRKTGRLRVFLTASRRGLGDDEWEHLVQVSLLYLTADSLGAEFVCVQDPLGRNIHLHIEKWFSAFKKAA
jgi:hypothetical protein